MTAILTKYILRLSDTVVANLDTFPTIKRKDEEKCGTYRTKDTILCGNKGVMREQRGQV